VNTRTSELGDHTSRRPIAAISISVPDARLDPKRERHLGAATKRVARAIVAALPDPTQDGYPVAGAISA
jgi:hypothetical protein